MAQLEPTELKQTMTSLQENVLLWGMMLPNSAQLVITLQLSRKGTTTY